MPVGAPPVDFQLEAGGYVRNTGERLAVHLAAGTSDRLQLGSVRVTRPASQASPPSVRPIEMPFGAALALRGYELSTTTPAPGERLRLTLYWASLAPARRDYAVFVHLAADGGRPAVQADGQPAYGAYPTSSWQAGDYVRDPHELALPADILPGRHWLAVGLYEVPNGARLPLATGLPSIAGRLGIWLERHSPYFGGPHADGDQVVLAAIDVQGRR